MFRFIVLLGACAALSFGQSKPPLQLWYYQHSSLTDQTAVQDCESTLDQAAAAGYNGVILADSSLDELQSAGSNAAYLQQVVGYAASKGLKVIAVVSPARAPQGDGAAPQSASWQRLQGNVNALGNVLPQASGILFSRDSLAAINQPAAKSLAWPFSAAYQLFHSAPAQSPVYVWSDPFDPASPSASDAADADSGSLDSWQSLPADVVVVNTNLAGLTRSASWFAGLTPEQPVAHAQLIAGYADSGDGAQSAADELAQIQNIPGVAGLIYTTETSDYSQLAPFAAAARAGWDASASTPAVTLSQPAATVQPSAAIAMTTTTTTTTTTGTWSQIMALPTGERMSNVTLLSSTEVFVALRTSGVRHSTDRGLSWKDVTPLAGLDCTQFLQAGSKLLVSCGGTGGGVFLWNGSSWHKGASSPTVTAQMVYLPSGQIVALFGSLSKVGFSTDGLTWTTITLPNLGLLQVFQRNPITGDIWLGTEAAGAWRSKDGGHTFTYAGNKIGSTGGPVNGATFIFANDGTTRYAEHAAIYQWLPATNNWQSLATGSLAIATIPYTRQTETSLLRPTGVIYSGTGQAYNTGNGYVYVSRDNGKSFSLATMPGLPSIYRVNDIKIDSLNYLWASLRDGGLWRVYVGP